jgi:hypothetical protein
MEDTINVRYQKVIVTQKWMGCSNQSDCHFKFVRVGDMVTVSISEFDFGVMTGQSLKTVKINWVPGWAKGKNAISSIACVNNNPFFPIIVIFDDDNGFIIHKLSGSSYKLFSKDDKVNIENISLTYNVDC